MWMLIASGVICGSLFGHMAAAYWLNGLVGGGVAGRVINMLMLMLGAVMIIATLLTLAERKWSAMMQDRIGPNRARIGLPVLKNMSLGGIPHIAADVLKLLFKEDFAPARANNFLFNLAPVMAFAPVFCLFAVVPAGPSVLIDGKAIDMVVASPDFGILFLFAIASLAVFGTSLAGWASNNKFALLGGIRASSQMISYEVALGLSLIGIMMAFSSVQPLAIQDAQARYLWKFGELGGVELGLPAWGIFLQPVGFLLFFAAAFAETKRAPFDVPEGESEIIGYFLEYSGMKFGLFMVSEFVEIVVLSGVIVALFFGGPYLPFGQEAFAAWGASHPIIYGGALGMVFWLKVIFFIWVQLVIRWTFPRFRYDQIQTLGWKILLPAGIANVFVTGALILWDPSLRWLALLGIVMMLIVLALSVSAREPGAAPHGGHGGHGGHDDHGGGHGHDDHGHAVGHGTGTPALTSPAAHAHAAAHGSTH
jgi:NADH-quinone oxidoreductase subunit H